MLSGVSVVPLSPFNPPLLSGVSVVPLSPFDPPLLSGVSVVPLSPFDIKFPLQSNSFEAFGILFPTACPFLANLYVVPFILTLPVCITPDLLK